MRTRRLRVASQAEIQSDSWMLTFSDLLMLLLTLFIMRLSMSTMISVSPLSGAAEQESKDTLASGSSSAELSPVDSVLLAGLRSGLNGARGVESSPASESAEMASIEVLESKHEIRIVMGQDNFPSRNPLDFSFRAEETFGVLSRLLPGKPLRIFIEAHRYLPKEDGFHDPWLGSAERAQAVLRQLTDRGVDPSNINLMGYADSKLEADIDLTRADIEYEKVEIRLVPERIAAK